MPIHRVQQALILLLAFLACPLQADDEWRLRVGGAWVDPSIDASVNGPDPGEETLESDANWGLSLAIERMISRRLGIELGATVVETGYRSETEVLDGLIFQQEAETDMTMLTAGLNFHLTPDRATDIYIGPLVAFIDFADTTIRDTLGDRSLTGEARTADDFALGAQIGADIPIGQGPWAVHVAAKYVDSELDLELNETSESVLEFEPLIFTAGFSFRF